MAKLFVLDLETSISKGPHSGSFRDPSNDFYTLIYGTNPDAIIVEHKEEGFKRQLSQGAADLLNKSDIITGHNLPFDLSYLWKTKELQDFIKKGGTTWDTQIAEYLMSGQRHAFASLAELQLLYLDQKVKESRISSLFKKKHGADEIIKAQNRCPRIFKLFDKYSKDDGETTFKIALKQIERAKRLGMINIIKLYNLYMLGLVNTSTSGLKVDMIKCEKTLRAMKLKSLELLEQSEAIVSKFWDNPKLPKFNVQSPTHKSALLFGGEIKVKVKYDDGFYKNGNPKTKTVEEHIPVVGFKLPIVFTSPSEVKGRYRTGAEIIDKIYSHTKDPVVKEYCTLQRKAMNLEKMCSTYLEPFLKLSINGYLYPNYNNTATSTGRLSSSKPNLQNIPSKGGIEKYIKNQFIAPEGYICGSIDYCQLEIYIQALVTKDQSLTNDLLSGVDFHILRLSYAEDMDYQDVYKLCKIDKLPEWELKRSRAKTISYQKAYGAAPKKLALSTGLDEEVIKKIFIKEDLSYPQVKEVNDKIAEEVAQNKELSMSRSIPQYQKGFTKYSKRFKGGIELLPIINANMETEYFEEECRHIGYYKSITGKRYAFEEFGMYDRLGRIKRGFKPTQIKNYPQQGGAADVVAAATAEIFKYILTLEDNDVLMINQVHDSIEFYVKEETKHLTLPKLKSIMEDVPSLFKKYLEVEVPFKFKCDVKIGENFYDMKEYK